MNYNAKSNARFHGPFDGEFAEPAYLDAGEFLCNVLASNDASPPALVGRTMATKTRQPSSCRKRGGRGGRNIGCGFPGVARTGGQDGAAARSWRDGLQGSGRLLGRKALITVRDFGMGRAAAIAYAREGAAVAINYFPIEEPDAQEVIALIQKEGRVGVAIPGDLREETFCKRLVEQTVRDLGDRDIVLYNAARQQSRDSILDISSEDFDATMKTNIYAPFWIIKAALPHLNAGSSSLARPPNRPTIPRRTFTTMLRPRRRR